MKQAIDRTRFTVRRAPAVFGLMLLITSAALARAGPADDAPPPPPLPTPLEALSSRSRSRSGPCRRSSGTRI